MPVKFSDTYKREALAVYDKARADGASVTDAAQTVKHAPGTIDHWRAQLAEADSDDGPRQIAKKRQCLRCRRAFKSAWAGHRVCDRCKGSERVGDGLPDSWGMTPTVCVAD